MVNPENDFVSCLTLAELHRIWGAAAEDKIVRWNQVRPEWPDRPLRLYGPGVDSGTFDYFTETINGQAQSSRADFTSSEDDNVLVHGIYGDKNSLGYFGYAYFSENREKLKALGVDGGEGCVGPTDETINGGSYSPLSRPLFIYVSSAALQKPHVKEFIRYYIGPEGWVLTSEVGYIPFREQIYQLISYRVEGGATGSIFGGDNPQLGSVEQVLSDNQ
jgi:phosphate transport system substrate-binding protein